MGKKKTLVDEIRDAEGTTSFRPASWFNKASEEVQAELLGIKDAWYVDRCGGKSMAFVWRWVCRRMKLDPAPSKSAFGVWLRKER